jgi:hypothetical protein
MARSPWTNTNANVTRMPTKDAPNVMSSPASGAAMICSALALGSCSNGATPRSVSINPANVPTSPTSTVTAAR